MPPIVRPAEEADYTALSRFLNSSIHLHRHLDWRDSLEWLSRQPFLLMEEDDRITAALSCVAEPEEVAWVRLFAAALRSSPDRAWSKLFEPALETLRSTANPPAIVSLVLREWYEDMLKRKGFTHHQDIIVFLFDQDPPPAPKIDPSFKIREMGEKDLHAVAEVDHLAFEPIWRLSLADLGFAQARSSYCTVLEIEGRVIGYTMSSSTGMYAHLARLAVHPDFLGQRLGYGLVQDLLDHFISGLNYWGVTLNTQHDNHASLALYHKVGFRETGERFPVYMYRY